MEALKNKELSRSVNAVQNVKISNKQNCGSLLGVQGSNLIVKLDTVTKANAKS